MSSILPQPDGKVIISGQFTFPGGEPLEFTGIGRLNADGSWDPSFEHSQLGRGKMTPWDDRFYIASTQTVRRVMLDGTNDPSFISMNTGPYFTSLQGGDYHVYPDGRILMSGAHQVNYPDSNWVGIYNLIWFTNEGYLDTTRAPRISDGVIYEIEELADGRFMCTGPLSTYEGESTGTIFRVEADGAFDPSFQSALAFCEANTFTPLADGRVLTSGLFMTSIGATDTTQFVRYMPDGSLDPTFNNDLVVSSAEFGRFLVLWHTRLPDGRILLHGNFDHVEGQWRGGIALLDVNGELLNTAFTGQGCGYYEYMGYPYHGSQGAALLGDSMMYIHGTYHGYDDGATNDPEQRFVTRLYGPDFTTRVQEQPAYAQMRVYPNPSSGIVSVELHTLHPHAELTLTDAIGCDVLRHRVVGDRTNLDLSNMPDGVYQIQLFTSGVRLGTQHLVVQH